MVMMFSLSDADAQVMVGGSGKAKPEVKSHVRKIGRHHDDKKDKDKDKDGDDEDEGDYDEYTPGVDYVVVDEDVEIPWDEDSYSDAEGLYDEYTPGGSDGDELSKISRKVGFSVTTADNVAMYRSVLEWLGTPYKYGGTSKKGVDCSGFVMSVYKSAMNFTLNRTAALQHSKNCTLVDKSHLTEGDLVFFRTDGKKTSTPNHVGLFLKGNKFAHASSSQGVVVSDLTSSYFKQTWLTGGHVKM